MTGFLRNVATGRSTHEFQVPRGPRGRPSVKQDTETMNMKITATKFQQILGYCAICTAVAFVSVSANAQNPGMDMELLHAAFEAADTSGDGRIDEAELAADTVAAFVAVDDNEMIESRPRNLAEPAWRASASWTSTKTRA